ncbi:hypothetical protein SCLCIDRAFT_1222237 [Scleroderma citrinum Foug A]|uniref:tRNA-splicing endonuclease subunit Sen15 domain-containing protein n=1 Tax=Scleroderma citrinum Foug A TaxID=1036808 RepID=A0A0C2YX75_9AGAM|nr:hypothetical protein SCLCIDRAFT_1222237 [Scleroderma citrinum Foug A]
MQAHPSYPELNCFLAKYPKSSNALFQTFNDLTLAQRWTNVELIDLFECQRAAIKGLRPSSDSADPPTMCVVVPCPLAEPISTSWLRAAFENLRETAPKEIFVAICTDDSSTVYYKISKGIVKPSI